MPDQLHLMDFVCSAHHLVIICAMIFRILFGVTTRKANRRNSNKIIPCSFTYKPTTAKTRKQKLQSGQTSTSYPAIFLYVAAAFMFNVACHKNVAYISPSYTAN